MKAIIMERRGDYAAVLCEDGTFVNARVAGEVGERIELPAKTAAFPRRKRAWLRSAVAAMLVLTITGGTLGYMGGTASAYVSLDVDEDSSIELTINHFGRVIAVNALDEDTRELAESVSAEVRHCRAEDAINRTMAHLHKRGFLEEEGGTVLVGVATDDEKRAAELKEIVERSVTRDGENVAYIAEMSRAERKQAMRSSVSMGRFGYEREMRPLSDGCVSEEREEGARQDTVPAQGAAGEIPEGLPEGGERPVPEQLPEGGERPVPEQLPEGDERPVPEQLPEGGERPVPEQLPEGGERPVPERLPEDGERPVPGQLPQDGKRPVPEQLPEDGERLVPEQLPQDGKRPVPPRLGVFVERPSGRDMEQPQEQTIPPLSDADLPCE